MPETLAPWREPVLASVPQPLHVACAHQTDVAQRVQDPHGVERVRRRAPIAPYRRRPPWSGRDRPPRYHVVTLVGTHSRPGRNRARHAILRRTHLGAPQGGRSGSRAKVEEQEQRWHYRVHRRRVWFDRERRQAHRRLKQSVPAYIREGSVLSLLTAPVIYSLLVLLALLRRG